MSVNVTQAKKSARIVDATAAPVVVSPGDTVYFKIKLHPYHGVDEVKTMSFTVPKKQPIGNMVLEVRGGGVIPLPYLIEKQRYNLTDEILERLRHYKDFAELKKEIEGEDANNDLVIEILDQNVSMINDGSAKTKKVKIRGKEPDTGSKDILKPDKRSLNEDAKKEAKSSIATPYIVKGDGQITIKVVPPEKRDAYLNKNHQLNEAKAVISDEAEEVTQNDDLVKQGAKGSDKKESKGEKTQNETAATFSTDETIRVINLASQF